MAQLLFKAGGAAYVDTAEIDFAFFADELSLATRAVGGEGDLFDAARMLLIFDDLDDLGDDVAAALDGDEVADADAETGDLIGVMQRSAGDRGAADEDGLELGDGCDLAGAPGLEGDAEELRDAGAGGELVRNGPARGFAGEAEAALLGGGVGLDDDAVDLVAEGVAEGFGLGDEGKDGVYVVYGAGRTG